MRIQVEQAKKWGLVFHIPKWVLGNLEIRQILEQARFPVVSTISLPAKANCEEKISALSKVLKDAGKGIFILTLHLVVKSPEIMEIIPEWTARHSDYKMLMDKRTKSIIKEAGFKLITWRDVPGICTALLTNPMTR